MRIRESQYVIVFCEKWEKPKIFKSVAECSKFFGCKCASNVYSVIQKGCSIRRNGVQYYVDYLFEGEE